MQQLNETRDICVCFHYGFSQIDSLYRLHIHTCAKTMKYKLQQCSQHVLHIYNNTKLEACRYCASG